MPDCISIQPFYSAKDPQKPLDDIIKKDSERWSNWVYSRDQIATTTKRLIIITRQSLQLTTMLDISQNSKKLQNISKKIFVKIEELPMR